MHGFHEPMGKSDLAKPRETDTWPSFEQDLDF